MMFDTTGGMFSPLRDKERLDRFFDCFLDGYEQEYHLSDFWHNKLELFINYRRLILFTCMQDWLNTQPELKQSILNMVKTAMT